ncbi:MAG: SDR family NAD(P)-dependent oxidoreductase, partial [Desulfovibrio sp.]|nr:SDR family NAD(P)-dependent oxidoreductase [Desulfovibrio sp.]
MSTLDPKQPTALVTGGSRGIGQAIAETLAHDGYQVLLTYQSKAQEAEAVVEKIKAQGGKARCAKLDVGEEEAITDFFASIKEEINLTCLVNNAGITKDGLLIRMKTEDFQKVIQVCLTGTFLCSREAAKLMTKKRTGRIINITSVVGLMGNAGQA